VPPLPQRITFRLAIRNQRGMLGQVTTAIDDRGGAVHAVQRTGEQRHVVFRDVSVDVHDEAHGDELAVTLAELDGVELLAIGDDVLTSHEGGKIRIETTREVNNAADLALVYTPGVAKVCRMIEDDPTVAYRFTIRSNSVAVVTDGSAVLGLGDIGPLAALPVMEGKAMLFKSFGGVDAYPILIDEQDPDLFVDTVARIASGFGGINLEDIAAPRCFEIEGKLRQRLDIPVFHDDQHGTAIVVLAALINASRVVERDLTTLKVVVQGIGAAGVAIIDLLQAAGVADIVPVDIEGIVEPRRKAGLDPIRRRIAKRTNPRQLSGNAEVALAGADVFIGVSGPDSLPLEWVRTMSRDRIVFAMSNPTPEIHPDLARDHVRVMATGRSDFPNQINNVLAFPGVFRGLLDCAATKITDQMKVAAAEGIASIVGEDLAPDYVIPSAFDRSVVPVVAEAVAHTARAQGHVRPGSAGSLRSESDAAMQTAARRAVQRAVARRFSDGADAPAADTDAAPGGLR
jgi:malate dehydrogenase (oxaloacetate-decarboxylating)